MDKDTFEDYLVTWLKHSDAKIFGDHLLNDWKFCFQEIKRRTLNNIEELF